MNILMINQPLNNRGDESAHKALVRRLAKEFPKYEINVLFGKSTNIDSIKQFSVEAPNVHYIHCAPSLNKGFTKIGEFGLKHRMHFLWFLHPGIRKWLQYFQDSDFVICAPGGINMGGFQSWYHLFNLYCAKLFNKPIAYYGRSIGPFPTKTHDNRLFKKISLELLNYFKYISLRDKKSEQVSNKLGIPYIPVVDTAFLDSPHCEIPLQVAKQIGNNPYFVFVPNSLIWHFAYKNIATKNDVIQFYTHLLKEAFKKYPDSRTVMLPQLFNGNSYLSNDVLFMRDIAKNFSREQVMVVDDIYSSDIQQSIISKSIFVIGARYHSIVFAINNSVPFIALSYEHKMEGLLETLAMKHCMVDITHLFDNRDVQMQTIEKIMDLLPIKPYDKQHTILAKNIAESGFEKLKKCLIQE